MGFKTTFTLASSGTYGILDDTILPGKLSVGLTSTYGEGGYFAMPIPAIGVGSVEAMQDDLGHILNLVKVLTDDRYRVFDSGDRVYGLLQCIDTAVDEDLVGPLMTPNTQLSFVKHVSYNTFQLVSLSAGDYRIDVPLLYNRYNVPLIYKVDVPENYKEEEIVIPDFEKQITLLQDVSAGFVFDITTSSIYFTVSGDVFSLPLTMGDFNNNGNLQVKLNGILMEKGSDVVWVSSTELMFPSRSLMYGEQFMISVT